MDTKEALRKGRINNIFLGMALLTSIGFFFYGMINNIQAQKAKELALLATERQMACEKLSISLTQQLQEKEKLLMEAKAENDIRWRNPTSTVRKQSK